MKGQKTGGRQKGSLNKLTADVRVLARKYTAAAMEQLDKLTKKADSDTIRLAAIRELLDRGYGKIPNLEVERIPSVTREKRNVVGEDKAPIPLDSFRRMVNHGDPNRESKV